MTPMSDKFWHLAAPLHSGVWEIQQNLSGMGPLLLAKFWTNAELLSQSYLATSDCLKILVLFSSSTENLIPKLATWNSWKSPPPINFEFGIRPLHRKINLPRRHPSSNVKFSSWAHCPQTWCCLLLCRYRFLNRNSTGDYFTLETPLCLPLTVRLGIRLSWRARLSVCSDLLIWARLGLYYLQLVQSFSHLCKKPLRPSSPKKIRVNFY